LGNGFGARQEERDGQGETARQPGDPEAQDSEIGGRCARLALRTEGPIGSDDSAEAEVRPSDDDAKPRDDRDFYQTLRAFGVDRPLPAVTYRVVVDEEDLPGLSFLAFRQTATMLHLPTVSERGGVGEVFLVDPDELAAALEADGAASGKGRYPPAC
jgi:hypothetical protein